MSNGKKNTPYFTSQDKSLIAPPLSKRRAAVEKIVKAYRQHKKNIVDDSAFDNMLKATPELSVMESDKTRADLLGYKADKSTSDIHNALLVGGLVPGVGAVADAADAVLYAMEGKLGEAGLSLLAMIPMFGQAASGKRVLKAGKSFVSEFPNKMLTRSPRNVVAVKMVDKSGKEFVQPFYKSSATSGRAVGKAERKGRWLPFMGSTENPRGLRFYRDMQGIMPGSSKRGWFIKGERHSSDFKDWTLSTRHGGTSLEMRLGSYDDISKEISRLEEIGYYKKVETSAKSPELLNSWLERKGFARPRSFGLE